MTFVTSHMSISLDGFVAGPDLSQEHPLGIGGQKVHAWHMGEATHPVDEAFTQRLLGPRGAYIMGRNMFGPVRGEWGSSDWRGWWGPEPPYHAPVFVLTHYAHEPSEMEGGTTFHFVDSFDGALHLDRLVRVVGLFVFWCVVWWLRAPPFVFFVCFFFFVCFIFNFFLF